MPGTSSNVAAAKPVPAPAGVHRNPCAVYRAKEPSQSSKTERQRYGVNRTTRHVIEPAGSIRRVTAAALLDDAIERKQEKGKWVETHARGNSEELRPISELAQAAIGFNSARGDVISVREPLASIVPRRRRRCPPSLVDRRGRELNDYSSIIRYAGLLVPLSFGLSSDDSAHSEAAHSLHSQFAAGGIPRSGASSAR